MAGPVLNLIYPARFVRRDIAEANRAALGEPAVYRVLAATGAAATDDAVLAVGAALAVGREHSEVVISAVLPYRKPRLEVGGGIAEEMLELTEEMARLETARGAMEQRGIMAKPTARLASDPAAELADIASSASALVISAEHPDYQVVTASAEVPVAVTLAAEVPLAWSTVAIRAGTSSGASAAAEVASLLAAGGHMGIVVDPAGLSGRALDRFVSPLRGAGLSTELSGQVPDDALIVARQDGPRAGAHLIVRAGPGYTPTEPAQFAVADVGQADIDQADIDQEVR
jgi:hypothetical protein